MSDAATPWDWLDLLHAEARASRCTCRSFFEGPSRDCQIHNEDDKPGETT